jgi:Integrase core domain
VKWLGITISPSYVGEPECNGVAERFMRTLREQCLYLHRFTSPPEARAIIGAFIARANAEWLIERLGHRTPAAGRARRWRRDHGSSRDAIAQWRQDRQSLREPYRDIPLWCPGNRERYTPSQQGIVYVHPSPILP